MDFFEKYKIGVNKKVILFLAGAFWSFAGGRVLTLGYGDLMLNNKHPWIYFVFAAAVFYVFFTFVFYKMADKHTDRIMSSTLVEHCVFSFLDFKGYVIMSFMIVGGISLRNAHIVNPRYLGAFYLGLGSALLSAGVTCLVSVLVFEKLKLKYALNEV